MIAVVKILCYRSATRCFLRNSPRFLSVFDEPTSELVENTTCLVKKFPTVSTIINKTMPVENVMILRKWQEKMRKQLGDQGFNDYITREYFFLISPFI